MTEKQKCTIDLGTILNYSRTRRSYRAVVEIELRPNSFNDPRPELAICGGIILANKRGWSAGGQCLDEINDHIAELTPENAKLFKTIYRLWKAHHLNGLHAGTIEQENALKDCTSRDYYERCNFLKEKGLYEVEVDGKPYRYGCGWLYREIPEGDLNTIKTLIEIYK